MKFLAAVRTAYHFSLAFLGALFFGFPSRRLTVIGITGTKGKTTVIELVHSILEESGAIVASLSSLRFRIGDREERNTKKMTMPGRFFVQKFLRDAVRARARYVVIEVTSEGIKQFRHRFVKFDIVAVTNLAPEHIEAHGSFEKYLRAKLDLFWRLPKIGVAVINRDDPATDRFAAATAARKIFYGRERIVLGDKTFAVRRVEITEKGIEFEINGNSISSKLLGDFNLYNILAASAIGLSAHVSLEKIVSAISRVSAIPGRLEFVQKEPFAVIADYAHTPDSLRQVYGTIRESSISDKLYPKRKLICVLGSAGGGRDKWKRPEMGKVAAEFCSRIILTNEDPYDEDPHIILDDIEKGIPTSYKLQAASYRKILDRREAIREAVKFASAGDTVIITGKGAEPWIAGPAGTKIPWDDREVVREELKRIS